MTLVPVMGWHDTRTGNTFQASLVPNPKQPDQPYYKSQLRVPVMDLKVKVLNKEVHKELKEQDHQGLIPTRSNATDAGLDLYAAEDVYLKASNSLPQESHRAIVSTGIAVEFPPGLVLLIQDRSGMSAKHGIHRVAGTVDSDYRGEVKVALVNLSQKDYQIKKGDRIAQAVLQPVILAQPIEVDELSDTSRGVGGFGSTGN
jgi:dUTP pyrophosphatase